jgi:hypothetical protein
MDTKRWRFGLLILTLLGLALPCPAAATADVRSEAPQVTCKTSEAAECAERFLRAWSTNDRARLRNLIAYPFLPYLPCKGGAVRNWNKWKDELGSREFNGRERFRVGAVVRPADYFRSLGDKEEDIRARLAMLGPDVRVVYAQNINSEREKLAVFVRVTRGQSRVFGIGWVKR